MYARKIPKKNLDLFWYIVHFKNVVTLRDCFIYVCKILGLYSKLQ